MRVRLKYCTVHKQIMNAKNWICKKKKKIQDSVNNSRTAVILSNTNKKVVTKITMFKDQVSFKQWQEK